ncbi:hypothetical protein GGS26DRAFT_470276 [Hypomontagnella submonticulosa]|nr:hypothetical protein GGS26DRAFT_470276 [Hypomontagnella submonticulosa]
MSHKIDEPPAYGAPPQHPQPSYQGGYPPQQQGPYGDPNQHYQQNPGMGYYPPGQGPPPQGGYYPPQQGYPPHQGQYQQPQERGGSDGCLGFLVGALACCCCLDCLF